MKCRTSRTVPRALLIASLSAALGSSAAAKDYVLTIGGGYSPLANQVSLERNVLFVRQVLADRLPDASHDILFSDGDSPGRDVQIRVADSPAASDPDADPDVWKLLARVFGQEKHWGLSYRTHEVTPVLGAATRENVTQWFEEVARRAAPGDRVIVYATAHGGKATGPDAQDTELYLWNNQRLPMSQFTALLERLPAEVRVVVVMVQCHAGGFANVIFADGRAERGASSAARAGFFATLFDRPASGCTPDVYTANDQEYSSYFWAALGGMTRDARTIGDVDFDGDGATSLAEAHAFAVINSQSVDVPVRTSEILLRRISPDVSQAMAGSQALDAPYGLVERLADPIDRAMLAALRTELRIAKEESPHTRARAFAAAALAQRSDFEERQRQAAASRQEESLRIRAALVARWPELANPWNPSVHALVEKESRAIAEAITSHDRYDEFERLDGQVESLATTRLDLTRRWAKCERLARTVENIVLAANLPLVAPPDAQARYRQLVALENEPFAAITP